MAEKRIPISKKTRFEVFKRDSFTCQYCGRTAPDVVLEIDHINPVATGGKNDIMNLITSCFDCNRGKGKRKLSSKEEIKKQQDQLKELEEKRQQLKMMIEWKKELEKFDDEQVYEIEKLLLSSLNISFSKFGKEDCKKWIKKYGFDEVYESTNISISQYYKHDNESVDKVINYIPRICSNRLKQRENPKYYKINYLIKIAKNDYSFINESMLRGYLVKNFKEDDFEFIKDIFRNCRNWYELQDELENYYGDDK